MKNVIICGSYGFAFEVVEYLKEMIEAKGLSLSIKGFLDEQNEQLEIHKFAPYLGTMDAYKAKENDVFVVGVLPNDKREKVIQILRERNWPSINVIHPSATISPSATLGQGNVFGPNCLVMSNVVMGDYNAFNCNCSVGHDSTMGNGNVFSSSCHITGYVTVGNDNFFGLRTSIIPEIKIGDNNKFQAGSTISNNITNKAFHHLKNINKVSYIFE